MAASGDLEVRAVRLDNNNAVLPWEEKHRPTTLNDIVGQQDAIHILRQLMKSHQLPHMLFHGPPGTGKTSTILAAVRELYGPCSISQMVLELNASDERNVQTIQQKVKIFASSRQIFNPSTTKTSPHHLIKIIILDEADAMNHEAQMALRRIMDDYTANTRFCIITNHIHKLSQALVSRCARFRFRPIPALDVQSSLLKVVKEEGVDIDGEAVEALARLCQGDMRQALNVLQECYFGEQKSQIHVSSQNSQGITAEAIHEYVGAPTPSDINSMLKTLLSHTTFGSCLKTMNTIKDEKGLDPVDLIRVLAERLKLLCVPPPVKVLWIEGLAEIEVDLSNGGSEMIQTGAIIGVVRSGLLLMNDEIHFLP